MSPELIIGLVSSIIGGGIQMGKDHMHDMFKLHLAALGKHEESANNAAKRGSAFGRRFAMVIVLLVAFGGLIYAAERDLGVSQIVNTEPFFNFFNMVKLGGGPKVVSADGLVFPDYVHQSVVAIIFFLFGSSAAKRGN